ncbi:DUF2637 domain-containing protein (plasmid) [Streptomyces virginiae]|uniref:DUF2637 domain-containing protein n=1 Tax=Streptomyces virginiae TaxID=1961 RepID=UPI00324CAF07
MTTTLEPGVHVPAPARPEAPSPTSAVPSRTSAEPSPTFAEAPVEAPETTRKAGIALGLVCLVLAPFVATVGFYLSFHNLSQAGLDRFGFPTLNQAKLFAGGVDGAIVLFLAADLFFVSRGRRTYWLLRPMAHVMTGATIYFNAAAHGVILDHLDKALAHAFMPVLFVICVEAGRHYLVQAAALEMGLDRGIPFTRWFFAPGTTWAMFSRMKVWGYSYETVMELERDRAVYNVWLEHREELEAGHKEGEVSALDRLPQTMKKFGMSVDDALALPDKMRRDDQKRRQDAEAASLRLDLEKEKADAEAEKERLRVQAEIDAVRASVKANTGIAEARAEAATAGARLQATTAVTAAKRAAEESDRRAAAEAAAEESTKVAEERAKAEAANAKVAEASAKLAEAERQEREAKRLAAEDKAKEEAALAKVAEESAKKAIAEQQTAEAAAKTAEARELTAQANLRAAEAEDLAGLSQRPRRVRRAARMLLDSVPAEAIAYQAATYIADHLKTASPVTGADIAAALGINSPGTASEYKTEALALIARGYNHHTGYDPDRTTQTEG